MEESIKIRGDVTVKVVDAITRETISLQEDKNLIVKIGKNLLARMLAGDVTALKADAIGFGTSGTAAAITDAGLGVEIVKKATTNVFYAAGNAAYNQAKFSATLLAADNNGVTYKELGLFSETSLFSRIVIGDIVKSVAYEIQVEWIISFQ